MAPPLKVVARYEMMKKAKIVSRVINSRPYPHIYTANCYKRLIWQFLALIISFNGITQKVSIFYELIYRTTPHKSYVIFPLHLSEIDIFCFLRSKRSKTCLFGGQFSAGSHKKHISIKNVHISCINNDNYSL